MSIRIQSLTKRYGPQTAVNGISFEAHPGEIVGFLGPNGAGKSTTLKAAMALLPLRSGEIRFNGDRIDGLDTHRIARLGLGYVPEERRIFADLTVAENLEAGRQPPRPVVVLLTVPASPEGAPSAVAR